MYIKFLFLLITLSSNVVFAQQSSPQTDINANELLVFKSPTCGCCKKWMSHMEQQGFVTYGRDMENVGQVKAKLGIKPNFRSCHTAITRSGFAFEGHVPAKFVKQFLAETHDNAIGLSVPAMPVGSPGMEVDDKFMPYKVLILFSDGSSKVYADVNTYQEQF